MSHDVEADLKAIRDYIARVEYLPDESQCIGDGYPDDTWRSDGLFHACEQAKAALARLTATLCPTDIP